MFAVLILTLNEERNLRELLPTLGSDLEIVVLDSGSTDKTVAIAGAAGAAVYERGFDTFANQRNHAHVHIPFRSQWVLHLDADERPTPELLAECLDISRKNPADIDGCYIAPKMLWQGRWLPRCTDYPAYQARFAHVKRFRFIEVGHGQREATEMRMGRLKAHYLHEMAANGEAEWIEKHRRYARREAQQHAKTINEQIRCEELLSPEPIIRRRALKRLSYRLPCRPFFRFVYQYVLRMGFLDGGPAFHYCRLLARYESFAQHELRLLRTETMRRSD